MPAPRSHVEDFFGCRTTAQSQTGSPREEAGPAGRVSTPRARCQRHPLFEERLPYDLSDARLQLVLTMLTSSLCSKANVQGVGSRHGGAPIHKSSMKRSMSDQSLRIQGRQPVNQDQIHRSMRRSGSEASLSTNLKGPPRIKTPKPRARASAATQQGAVAPSPAISSASRFYARVVRTQQELFCCDLHQQQACPEEVSRNQRRHGITTQQAMRMCDGA